MQVSQDFFVGIQDVGVNNEITNRALLEALTNTANVHGNLVGQSIDDRLTNSFSWVVLNWKLRVFQRPKACETIRVTTWAQTYSMAHVYRDFTVADADGVCVAQATSNWVAADIVRGSVVRLGPEIMDVYGCEPDHQNFPGFKFQKLRKAEFPVQASALFTVNKSMIDCNRHVHNPAYLDLANEVLPDGIDSFPFENVEVSYKREIRPRETVLLEYSRDGETHRAVIRDQTDNALHAVILLY